MFAQSRYQIRRMIGFVRLDEMVIILKGHSQALTPVWRRFGTEGVRRAKEKKFESEWLRQPRDPAHVLFRGRELSPIFAVLGIPLVEFTSLRTPFFEPPRQL